jgi:hypothetical protein
MERLKHLLCLDIIPLLFHTVTQTVVAYGETILALEQKGKVRNPKPLLGLGFDGVVRCKSLNMEIYFYIAKHVEVRQG